MPDDIVAKTAALRDEAWEAVRLSSTYATYKALDDAVVAMGGKPLNPFATVAIASNASKQLAPHLSEGMRNAFSHTAAALDGRARVSQPDAAEAILREKGIPTPGAELLAELPSKGATVSGANQMVNFTSSMSKSGRFRSIRHDGGYFWWFKDVPLPLGWNEAEPDQLSDLIGSASSNANQKGGDGHAPATT